MQGFQKKISKKTWNGDFISFCKTMLYFLFAGARVEKFREKKKKWILESRVYHHTKNMEIIDSQLW